MGCVRALKALVAGGASLELAEDGDGMRALHNAAHFGQPACVAELLRAGARPDARCLSGKSTRPVRDTWRLFGCFLRRA